MSYQEESMDARAETFKEDRLAGANVPMKDAPLKRVLKTQEKLLATLGVELDDLQQRLAPITASANEIEAKDTLSTVPHVGDSSIVRGIVDINNMLEEYITKVGRLKSRLEL